MTLLEVRGFRDKAREVRLRWFGRVQRMLKTELPGKRRRGRPKRRGASSSGCSGELEENMKVTGVRWRLDKTYYTRGDP